jgi:hypothetical protein
MRTRGAVAGGHEAHEDVRAAGGPEALIAKNVVFKGFEPATTYLNRRRFTTTLHIVSCLRYRMFLFVLLNMIYIYIYGYIKKPWPMHIRHWPMYYHVDSRDSDRDSFNTYDGVAGRQRCRIRPSSFLPPPHPPPAPGRQSVAAYPAGRLRQVCNSISPSPYRRGSMYVFNLF